MLGSKNLNAFAKVDTHTHTQTQMLIETLTQVDLAIELDVSSMSLGIANARLPRNSAISIELGSQRELVV